MVNCNKLNFQNRAVSQNIKFGQRINSGDYDQGYIKNKNLNGYSPDEFVIEQLRSQPRKVVLDLGAGQGRNSIPIAKMGYKVFACEISSVGQESIRKKSINEKIASNLKVLDKNILDNIGLRTKADFAFMAHISQHFNIGELKDVLQNVKESIKDGGEFVFDALIRTKDNYKKFDKTPWIIKYAGLNSLETYGAASFKKEEVVNAIKEAGFKIVQEVPFNEKNIKRAGYEKQNLWGGFKVTDFLLGIAKRPVKLTWFVLQKA